MKWDVIDTGIATATQIMELDAKWLLEIKKPRIHFYEWDGPSATYGLFIKPDQFFAMDEVERIGLRLAKRSTGGGVIFHLWDFAFSVFLPSDHPEFSQNTLENYAYINRAVLESVKSFLGWGDLILTPEDGPILGQGAEHFCMAKPTKYDVMLGGKKIAGAAQRKTKTGLLHQGSISLMMPDEVLLKKLLLPSQNVIDAMKGHTLVLANKETVLDVKKQFKELLTRFLIKEI